MSKAQTFGEFIMDRQADFPFVSGQLTQLLTDIGVAAKIVNQQVNRAGLTSILGASGNTNIQDEQQQKLDVFADDTFMRILSSGKSVCGIGSEEREDFVLCGENGEGRTGKYIVLIDPLDGSSNIDVNVNIGTIFSIVRRITPMGDRSPTPTSFNLAPPKWPPGTCCTGRARCWSTPPAPASTGSPWIRPSGSSSCPIRR